MIRAEEPPCYFCLRDFPIVAEFGVRRMFDFAGLPSDFAAKIKRDLREHFTCCAACAALIRTKDVQGLQDRADFYLPEASDSKDEKVRKIGLLVSARLNQQVFLLGNSTIFGEVVKIYDHVEPGYRVLFDIFGLSIPGSGYAKFRNGVDLWCAPIRSGLLLEEIRSSARGLGHASRVMQATITSADLHEVTLFGNVEAHSVNGAPFLSDADLFAWYGKVGFMRSGPLTNTITRQPQTALSLSERQTAFSAAAEALR